MLERYEEVLRPVMTTCASFLLMMAIFLFAHIVACMWYFAGSYNEQPEGFGPLYGAWSDTKEMMQPCTLYLHVISLVGQL